MSLSVIMVSYRTGPSLIGAVRAAAVDADEVIVVDNGNPPEARRALLRAVQDLDTVRLVQGHGNIGFARACNYGAALSHADHLLFLNPDTDIEPGAASALAEAGNGRIRPWIAGGLIVDDRGRELRGARRGELTPGSVLSGFNRTGEPLPDGPVPMPTITGAMLMTDRASFRMLGGFDEAYFLHVEDIDLCRRARRAGGEVIFVPQARALHHGATSDVPPWRVEAHKLRGLLRYFWTQDGRLSKLTALLLSPFLIAAVTGRAVWRSFRRT
ncbi:MAG: glycosyltransferase family 2 protein [Litorimonas sp.]